MPGETREQHHLGEVLQGRNPNHIILLSYSIVNFFGVQVSIILTI